MGLDFNRILPLARKAPNVRCGCQVLDLRSQSRSLPRKGGISSTRHGTSGLCAVCWRGTLHQLHAGGLCGCVCPRRHRCLGRATSPDSDEPSCLQQSVEKLNIYSAVVTPCRRSFSRMEDCEDLSGQPGLLIRQRSDISWGRGFCGWKLNPAPACQHVPLLLPGSLKKGDRFKPRTQPRTTTMLHTS